MLKFVFAMLLALASVSYAAPESKLIAGWMYAQSAANIELDKQSWQAFLDAYVIEKSGQTYVRYDKVTKQDHRKLKAWLKQQQSINPNTLAKAEFYAYWLNLYNALTVDLILDNYPIKSITKLGGWLSFGPWDDEIAKVNGKKLSLNDIEHGILRPIFKDARIHYAVNCASLGCPNLATTAFDAENLEQQLDAQARAFVNHARGVKIQGNSIELSSIYDWYSDDFGDLFEHLRQYSDEAQQLKLQNHFKDMDYDYDWNLNLAR